VIFEIEFSIGQIKNAKNSSDVNTRGDKSIIQIWRQSESLTNYYTEELYLVHVRALIVTFLSKKFPLMRYIC